MGNYKYILVPIVTLILSQLIKFILESIKCHKLVWGRLFNGSGGMPSSHTSLCISITTLVGLNLGFDSPLFGVSLVFSLIIMYDAMGLRMQSGKHAEAINKLLDQVFEEDNYKHLKEQLGHKPMEVLGGLVFGIISAILLNMIFY